METCKPGGSGRHWYQGGGGQICIVLLTYLRCLAAGMGWDPPDELVAPPGFPSPFLALSCSSRRAGRMECCTDQHVGIGKSSPMLVD